MLYTKSTCHSLAHHFKHFHFFFFQIHRAKCHGTIYPLFRSSFWWIKIINWIFYFKRIMLSGWGKKSCVLEIQSHQSILSSLLEIIVLHQRKHDEHLLALLLPPQTATTRINAGMSELTQAQSTRHLNVSTRTTNGIHGTIVSGISVENWAEK